MPWRYEDIADALAAGMAEAEARLAEEQAVHGLDALDEVALHPILAAGTARAGHAVFRETPYPGQPDALPKESQRLRCDLVLGPAGCTAVADVIHQEKAARRAAGTLFADLARSTLAPPPGAAPPEDLLWLEIKSIGQHTYVDGVAGPNRSYSSQFNTCLADVRKLSKARAVEHAALAVVCFSERPETAAHDLAALVHRCLDRDLPVAGLASAAIPILDRIGNAACTVGVLRVRTGLDDPSPLPPAAG